MSDADTLATIKTNILAQLADITANPKPSYTSGDRSVSWTEHYNALMASLKDVNLLLSSEDPVEVVTQAYVE